MSLSKDDVYEEVWMPWFAPMTFFLPCFWKCGVRISGGQLIFGYGWRGPSKSITGVSLALKDIDPMSITTGNASWWSNLTTLGGWGIRYRPPMWAYNAANGPYIEF